MRVPLILAIAALTPFLTADLGLAQTNLTTKASTPGATAKASVSISGNVTGTGFTSSATSYSSSGTSSAKATATASPSGVNATANTQGPGSKAFAKASNGTRRTEPVPATALTASAGRAPAGRAPVVPVVAVASAPAAETNRRDPSRSSGGIKPAGAAYSA